jgi:GNAT superfamily N-acetyltransferase
VRIRPADVSAADRIAEVHVVSWKVGYRGLLPQDLLDGLEPRQRVPRWRASIEATSWPRRGTLLAVVADLVVGFVNLCPTRNGDQDAESVGEITSLYVLPEQWGRGIGRRLMQASIQTVTDAGFHTATRWVLDTNTPAVGFYQAQGWRPDGAIKNDVIGGAPIRELRFVRALAEVTYQAPHT